MVDDEQAALRATALVTRACSELGYEIEPEFFVYKDHDDTFVCSVGEKWVMLQRMNNEDQGVHYLLVDIRDGAPYPVMYVPGPWEERLRRALEHK